MTKQISMSFVFCLAVSAVTTAQTLPLPKRLIAETDVAKFVWSADPQVSFDGRTVAFVRVDANEKKDEYETSIWIAATDGKTPPRRFTTGPRDTAPRFSPDG